MLRGIVFVIGLLLTVGVYGPAEAASWELWIPPEDRWFDPPAYDEWEFEQGGFASFDECRDTAKRRAGNAFTANGNKASTRFTALMAGICYDTAARDIYPVSEGGGQTGGSSSAAADTGSSGGDWSLWIPPVELWWDPPGFDEYEFYEDGFASLDECQDYAEEEGLDAFIIADEEGDEALEDLSFALDEGICYNEATDEKYWAVQ